VFNPFPVHTKTDRRAARPTPETYQVKSRSLVLAAACSAALLSTLAFADFRFIHASDTHGNTNTASSSNIAADADRWKEISALDPKPAFIVTTGDICDLGTDEEYAIFNKYLAESCTVKNYFTTGNHDVRWNPLGKEGYTQGVGQPLYQSWTHDGVHFVALDSTVLLQHWGHIDQAELDWLKADLEKLPSKDTPVVIGFHHWVGRESVQVDNEQALLDLVKPYNVRLWLQGHGHSDIQWNVNGTPAMMQKGLYQGSYSVVDVDTVAGVMHVKRRAWGKPNPKNELIRDKSVPAEQGVAWTDVFTIPLARPVEPKWSATVTADGPTATVKIDKGNLPAGTTYAYRFNQSGYQPTAQNGKAPTTRPSIADLPAGIHMITVQATLPDKRAYQIPVEIKLQRSGTPQPAWTAQLHGAVLSHLVRDGQQGGALYVTTMSGNLYSVAPEVGKVNWKFEAKDSIFSTPDVHDGVVYFGSADHHVYAVDARTGQQKWKFETKAGVFAGPAVAKGVAAIVSTDKTVYGLDAATGKVKWTSKVGGMYQSKAATDGNRFYFGGWDNSVRCVDAATGKEVWTTPAGRNKKTGNVQFAFSPAIASPTVADGIVYITSNDGVLHALNADTGKTVWEIDENNLGYSSPLVHDGVVYCAISNGGNVFAADAKTGKRIWTQKTGSDIYDSSFVFSNGNVYIGNVDGTFSSLDAKSGKINWQYRLGPGHVLCSPAADDDRVYISSMSGKVTALPLTADKTVAAK
jgi:outer membrane protein assembly factor BamB